MSILRMPAVKAETGYRSHASIYNLIREGLFVKQVPMGPGRAVGWPANEVQALITARIGGRTDNQIRELVLRLHAKRDEMVIEWVVDMPQIHNAHEKGQGASDSLAFTKTTSGFHFYTDTPSNQVSATSKRGSV